MYESRYKSGPLFVFMSERRAAHRHRVLKGGAIELSGGGAISCAVKNLLASGAALEVVSALDVPDCLILCIPRGTTERLFVEIHRLFETLEFREPYRIHGVQSSGEN